MYIYFWFILIFLVVNSFLLLEEETLIVIASIVWLDAAGGVIRNLLWKELEVRGDEIKDKFLWYLTAKKNLIELLLSKHETRRKVYQEILAFYEYFIISVLTKLITKYIQQTKVNTLKNYKLDLNLSGSDLASNIVYKELEVYLDNNQKNNFLDKKRFESNSWVSFLNK